MYIGHAFFMIFIFGNLVLLLNMVIAMMADTYTQMDEVKRGVYNYQILSVLPQLKINKTFGGLIAFVPPFNMIAFMFLPVYVVLRNQPKRLESVSKVLMMVNYVILLMVLSVIYVALNLLMLPLAYIKTVLAKISLRHRKAVTCSSTLSFLVLGVPILLAIQIADLIDFIRWSTNTVDPEKCQRKVI